MTWTLTADTDELNGAVWKPGKLLITPVANVDDVVSTVQITGPGGVLYDPFEHGYTQDDAGKFSVTLPSPGVGVQPSEFGFKVRVGTTGAYVLVPAQADGTTHELRDFIATPTTIPMLPGDEVRLTAVENLAAATAADVAVLQDEEDGTAADLAAHIADGTGAHAASAISNTPAGGIAATTVQAALNELDTEKAPNLTTRAVSGTATVADLDWVEADATSGVFTVTGPAAGAKRWGVKKVNGTSAVPGNKVTISYLNSAGSTVALDLTLAGESKIFRPSGSGYRVESGDTPKAGLDALYGVGSDQWLKENAAAFNFAFASLTTVDAATGLPTAAPFKWPDGTTGAFTGTTDGTNGYTTYAATYVGGVTKTVTASGITYDVSTGLALGPTGLVVS